MACKTTRNTLLPTSGVGPWTAAGNNKIIFSVPSYRNSFIDPKRSYLRFDFKLNSAASRVFRSSVAPFRRMTIRDSRGRFSKMLLIITTGSRSKTCSRRKPNLKSQLATTRNNMVMGADAEFSSPVPVVHQLQSGLSARTILLYPGQPNDDGGRFRFAGRIDFR